MKLVLFFLYSAALANAAQSAEPLNSTEVRRSNDLDTKQWRVFVQTTMTKKRPSTTKGSRGKTMTTTKQSKQFVTTGKVQGGRLMTTVKANTQKSSMLTMGLPQKLKNTPTALSTARTRATTPRRTTQAATRFPGILPYTFYGGMLYSLNNLFTRTTNEEENTTTADNNESANSTNSTPVEVKDEDTASTVVEPDYLDPEDPSAANTTEAIPYYAYNKRGTVGTTLPSNHTAMHPEMVRKRRRKTTPALVTASTHNSRMAKIKLKRLKTTTAPPRTEQTSSNNKST